jgi:hypothetical protein
VLLHTIETEAEGSDLTTDDLTVGGAKSDPFRMDTPANHRLGKWLADHIPIDRKIHLRGLHYLLVSKCLARPDGKLYLNDLACWQWLGTALNAARWLGYVGFDQIDDERNAEPIWAPISDPATAPGIAIDEPTLPDPLELANLVPDVELAWDGAADRQRYHLCLLGEKTGLRSVLAPLAKEFGADLILDSGEPSNTHMYQLVTNAIVDGRPLVILTFTDCDPTGQGIPASVARKVQAMLAMFDAGDLHVQVIRAGLTVEQARDLDLPSMPLKDTERRADRWQAATGRGQTEIDALLALQPKVLEQIARDAIAPFYDADLARRAREAQQDWEDEARRVLDEKLDQMPAYRKAMQQLQEQHAAYAAARVAIEATVSDLHAVMEQAIDQSELPDVPELPEWTAPDVPVPAALFDSADTFVANTKRLRQAKLADDDE